MTRETFKGAIIVTPPSIIGAWASDLLRDGAAAAAGPLEVRTLERLDDLGPEESWWQKLYLTRFPSASVISAIEDGRIPVIGFVDEACDTVAYIRRTTSCSFIEALRLATSASVANRALLRGKNAFVVRRNRNTAPDNLMERIFEHVNLPLASVADALKLKLKYCGNAKHDVLEERLSVIASYKPQGEWSSEEISEEESKIVNQVLQPIVQMAFQKESLPVKWPCAVLLSPDRPNGQAPIVADVTGAARNIYYGPYFHLPPGTYRARLVAGFSKSAVGSPFSIEVAASTLLAKARFRATEQGIFRGEFIVRHRSPQDPVEVRFRNDEGAITGQVGLAWIEFELEEELRDHNVT
jgi:hypothetical protein